MKIAVRIAFAGSRDRGSEHPRSGNGTAHLYVSVILGFLCHLVGYLEGLERLIFSM